MVSLIPFFGVFFSISSSQQTVFQGLSLTISQLPEVETVEYDAHARKTGYEEYLQLWDHLVNQEDDEWNV